MSLDKLDDLLKSHKQLDLEKTCSASGHEFVAKLMGKLPFDKFPLQEQKTSEMAGFGFDAFLNSIGVKGADTHELPDAAMGILTEETNAGRFPLVSSLAGLEPDRQYWHIIVALPHGGQVALADPGRQSLTTVTSADTLALLKKSAAVPGRNGTVHLLRYS